ncbi:threonylcarbamoyl-AMP synthase [Candidatus Microgenomates bacterium]|nr:MAG: threonylcarbamoyl-AMP synthase [Candidatus Microgenomates bacterium]
MNEMIKKAVNVLKKGGIIIFPTDTAFGIGCRVDDKRAVERLFEIRKRPQTQSTPILVDTVKMAQNYLLPIPKGVIDKLIEPFWPGALTIVLPSRIDIVPELVRGGGNTLGVRIPNHPIARKLIREVGVGILGPSANFHGGKTPFKLEDLDEKLIKLVDYIVPGECSVCEPSTVIDCSVNPWKILRQGAIKVQSSEKTILIIDTSSNQEIKVGLKINGKEFIIQQKIGVQKAQVVLPMVEKILKKHNLGLKDLTGIEVSLGPGSFTGLRVGTSIANALGFLLKIPINNRKAGELVEPEYGNFGLFPKN